MPLDQRSPNLPLDVLEHIINFLLATPTTSHGPHNNELARSLGSCSLAHHSLLHFIRKHRFHSSNIGTCLPLTDKDAIKTGVLADLVSATPLIGGYIRSLTLSVCPAEEQSDTLARYPQIFSIFQHFSNVRKLVVYRGCHAHFATGFGSTWTSFTFGDVIKTLIQSDKLETLILFSVKLPLFDVRFGANLRSLSMWSNEITDINTAEPNADDQQVVQLHNYTMGLGCAAATNTILTSATHGNPAGQQIFDFSRLHSICAVMSNPKEFDTMLAIVQKTTSLIRIDLNFMEQLWDETKKWCPIPSTLFIALVPSISTLKRIGIERKTKRGDDLLIRLPQFLGKMSHVPNVFERLSLTVSAYSSAAWATMEEECDMLDAVLGASTQWPCLKSVTIHITYVKGQTPPRPAFALLSASKTVSFAYTFLDSIYS